MDALLERTMFHGTSHDFEVFSLDQCGTGTKMPLGYLGIYFTPCPLLASKFCKNKWNSKRSKYRKGSRVIPVSLAASKIKYWNAIQFIQHSGSSPESLIRVREELTEQGFDCIVVKASEKYCLDELYEPQVIVLNPNIINFKLAA